MVHGSLDLHCVVEHNICIQESFGVHGRLTSVWSALALPLIFRSIHHLGASSGHSNDVIPLNISDLPWDTICYHSAPLISNVSIAECFGIDYSSGSNSPECSTLQNGHQNEHYSNQNESYSNQNKSQSIQV